MGLTDVAAVTAIEAASPSPWSAAQIAAELQRERGQVLVAVSLAGEIDGWCCGHHAGNEAELLKVAIRPEKRRRGIAVALLQELCTHFYGLGVDKVFLEVRSRNFADINLYTRLGWLEAGRRKKYYGEPEDDAIIFVCRLTER